MIDNNNKEKDSVKGEIDTSELKPANEAPILENVDLDADSNGKDDKDEAKVEKNEQPEGSDEISEANEQTEKDETVADAEVIKTKDVVDIANGNE